jgi:hypothetical protein
MSGKVYLHIFHGIFKAASFIFECGPYYHDKPVWRIVFQSLGKIGIQSVGEAGAELATFEIDVYEIKEFTNRIASCRCGERTCVVRDLFS